MKVAATGMAILHLYLTLLSFAILFIDGEAQLIRERETFDDLLKHQIPLKQTVKA